jgi:arylsulfate sulfotransferase
MTINYKPFPKSFIVVAVISLLFFNSCGEPTFEYSVASKANPNTIAPLTAMLTVHANKPVRASFRVLGATEVSQSFDTFSENLEVPVVGLYANRENKVVLTLTHDKGSVSDTISITTEALPEYFPRVEINNLNRNGMEPGLHLCDVHYAKNGTYDSRPFIFDDQGEIRWYLNLDFFGDIIWPIQRLKDGALLVGGTNNIYEFDMLGKIIRRNTIDPIYRIHHDIVELPNGELLMAVKKEGQFITVQDKQVPSFNDFIIHYDRETNTIKKEWDLAKSLDVDRFDLNHMTHSDWLHMNGLAFDDRDSTIVVSGKNQGIIKIDWNDNLKWIMAPQKNWGNAGRDGQGFATKPFLLTAVNKDGIPYNSKVQMGDESPQDFDFPWGQHAPKILPNGNIIMFDNGNTRNFKMGANYSKAVEYEVNEKDKTVTQNWQFGKERGNQFFSMLISDVDYLPETKNILVTSGFINHNAKIVEVTYPQNNEVFEATLYFKTLNGNKTFNWGQLDLLYRSERFELKY